MLRSSHLLEVHSLSICLMVSLHHALQKFIQLWMMRFFISSGVLIAIENSDTEMTESYAGAFLQHVPPELQFSPQFCVAEGDFLFKGCTVDRNTLTLDASCLCASKLTLYSIVARSRVS